MLLYKILHLFGYHLFYIRRFGGSASFHDVFDECIICGKTREEILNDKGKL